MRWIGLSLVFGSWLVACQDTNVQEKASQSQLSSDDLAPESKTPTPDDEQVVPPNQISGAWLGAVILNQNATARGEQSKIGLAAFYKGFRVNDNPTRFLLTVSTTVSVDSDIRVDMQTSTRSGYDRILTIGGPNQKRIKQALAAIDYSMTIVDTQDNSSDSISGSIEQALNQTKTSVVGNQVNETSTSSTSTSTSSSIGSDSSISTPTPKR